ncbi:sex-regulated protein janus-A-like isoform X1 [Sipha flava]|uniref:Sex-regulated protein janus-A n=1 Tax=Sipha flava TaxID=143950 RepID=A0A2S2RBC4_9HEMI|nr:sex-regulated protein janus-A-like isoform X1 [Sipha flava]
MFFLKKLPTFSTIQPAKSIRTMSSSVLQKIPNVGIDNRGRYKYILIKVVDQNDSSNQFKYVVRGGRAFEYHADIYDNFKKCVKPDDLNVTTNILGGGWLEHGQNSIIVEGASVQYGPADHSISASVLEKAYPNYKITHNDE